MKYGGLLVTEGIIGHPEGPESVVLVLLDQILRPKTTFCYLF